MDPAWEAQPNADPLGGDGGFRIGSLGSHAGGMASGAHSVAPSLSASHLRQSGIWPLGEEGGHASARLGLVEDMERVSCRLMHSFPWSAAGQVREERGRARSTRAALPSPTLQLPAPQVHTALALARRETMLEGHTKQKQRGRIVATLEHALARVRHRRTLRRRARRRTCNRATSV